MTIPRDAAAPAQILALELLALLRDAPGPYPLRTARSNYDRARIMYGERRARDAIFGHDLALFGEPAWDVLLDLYIARAEGRRISPSGACIAAVVPETAALRWIDSLIRRGFVDRFDHSDGSFLRLSDKGLETMELFFQFGARN